MLPCPFDLIEQLETALDELQETLSECDAEEPLSVRYCIGQWRNTMDSGQKVIRNFLRGKQSDADDDL